MNAQEATKVISEYMGESKPYSESLDALVPVWDKLEANDVWLNGIGNKKGYVLSMFSNKSDANTSFCPVNFTGCNGENIYEVCCITTAKAIKELVK